MKHGWEIKKLGDVLEKTETIDPTKQPDKTFIYLDVSSVNKETKQIEFPTTILGIDAPSRARKLIKENDIIFATVRPTHCRVALITSEYNNQVCSTGYFVIRTKKEIISNYIFYFILAFDFMKKMELLQKGANYPAVSENDVRSVIIKYPKSILEQERIVSILDNAFSAIDQAKQNAEKNLKNAKELFDSYLNGIFTNKGDDWVDRKLSTLSEKVSVGHVGQTSTFYCEPFVGVPFIRSQNVRSGCLDWKGIQYITREFHHSLKKSQLKLGDMLFVRVGVNRGDCCVLKDNVAELNCANIVFARLKEGNVNFIDRFCQSSIGKKQLLGMSVGAAQGVINTKSVAELVIPYPSISEQQTIVQKLDALSAETKQLEVIYQQKLIELEKLKKSILQKAFNGDL